MKRLHWALLPVVLILVVGTCAALAWKSWALSLPAPQQSDRDQLLRWLVLREIADQPWDVQVALVDRLEEELAKGLDARSQGETLDDQYARQLASNVKRLKEVWFLSRVEHYSSCALDRRGEFLKHQLAVIASWSQLDVPTARNGSHEKEEDDHHQTTSRLFADIERWMAQAGPAMSERMSQAVRDGTIIWLSTRSLADEPMTTRRDLAQRIASELDRGLSVADVGSQVGLEGQKVLQENSLLLLEVWLLDQAETLDALPPDEHVTYVDEQLDRILAWGILDWIAATAPAGSASSSGTFAGPLAFLTAANQWVQRAPLDQQPQLRRLLQLTQQRLFLRSLSGLFPSPSE